jgi:hypothetical protein
VLTGWTLTEPGKTQRGVSTAGICSLACVWQPCPLPTLTPATATNMLWAFAFQLLVTQHSLLEKTPSPLMTSLTTFNG